MILCVAANPSIDRLFAVERLIPGEIHRPAEFAQVPGGKGLNVARSAAALGGDVTAAALLGGHAGRWIAEQLEAEGVPLRAAWSDVETRSSLSVAGAIEGQISGSLVTEPTERVDPERMTIAVHLERERIGAARARRRVVADPPFHRGVPPAVTA